MAFRLLQAFPAQWSDLNGDPLVGGTLEFQNWNTSAPIALFTDSAGTSLGTSCTLNNLGLPQTSGGTACQLFGSTDVTAGYKIIRKDADGTVIGPALGPIFPVPSSLSDLQNITSANVPHDPPVGSDTTVEAYLNSALRILADDNTKQYRVVAGVIRNTGDGWELIGGHGNIGVGSVTETTANIIITFDFTCTAVVSFVITPDETFARQGLLCGASVGFSAATISLAAPLTGTVGYDTNLSEYVVTVNDIFDGKVTISTQTDPGGVIVAHDDLNSGINTVAQVTSLRALEADVAATSDLAVINTSSQRFTVVPMSEMSGLVTFGGATWVLTTNSHGGFKDDIVITFLSGVVTVTHPGGINPHGTKISSSGIYTANLLDVTSTTFTVEIRDYAGALVTTANTDMRFYFSMAVKTSLTDLVGPLGFNFSRDTVALNPVDVVAEFGNLWFYGIFEV